MAGGGPDRLERVLAIAGWLLIAALAVLAIHAEFLRTRPGDLLWDFGSFLESGRAARAGLDPYGIYPLTFHVVLPGFEAWNPNLNPPISALIFQLFDVAEPHRVFRAWYLLSCGLYAATLALLFARYRPAPLPALALWAAALAGFWDTLLLGQIYIPLVLAAAAAWLLLERGRPVAAGLLIGLVVAMKPNFAVWPALLFLSGRARPAIAAGLCAALVSLVPLLFFGAEIYRQWFDLLASDAERAFFLTNASLTGLAARFGAPGLGLALSAVLLVAAAVWAVALQPPVQKVGAVGLLVSLLASPIAWIHYTLFLLPVFLAFWRITGLRLAALLLIVPVPVVIGQFGASAGMQVSIGSVYNWALILALAALVADELGRLRRPTMPEAPAAPSGRP